MRIKRDTFDTFFYCLFCVITLGGLWVYRLAITAGIKKALED